MAHIARCGQRCDVSGDGAKHGKGDAMRCENPGDARAFSLWKSSAMPPHDVKTLAMRCRDAGHSGGRYLGFEPKPPRALNCTTTLV